jgi:hypothetical protein
MLDRPSAELLADIVREQSKLRTGIRTMAKKFTLRFECESAAFVDEGDPSFEIARVLRDIAARVETGELHKQPGYHKNAIDWNGNVIGTYVIRDE